MFVCLVFAFFFAILKNTVNEPPDVCDLGGNGPMESMCSVLGMLSALGAGVFAVIAWASSGMSHRHNDRKEPDDETTNTKKP
jgi:hypothetical protein